MSNTTNKTYADGDPLLEDDLDNLYENLKISVDNLDLATTGSTSGDLLASTGSNLAPAFVSPDTVAANMTSTGANAIAADITSTGADDIALSMTSSGANYIGATINAASVCNYIGTTMTSTGANAIFGDINASSSSAVSNDIVLQTVASTATSIFDKITSCSASIANIVLNAYTRTTGSAVTNLGVGLGPVVSFFTTTSATYTDVTGLGVSITSNGRPIVVELAAAGGSLSAYIGSNAGGNIEAQFEIGFIRASQMIASFLCEAQATGASSVMHRVAPGVFRYIDSASAGTHVYSTQVRLGSITPDCDFNLVRMTAYEL